MPWMFFSIIIVHEHDYYNIALTLRNLNNKHIYNIFNRLDCANINLIICANSWCKHFITCKLLLWRIDAFFRLVLFLSHL